VNRKAFDEPPPAQNLDGARQGRVSLNGLKHGRRSAGFNCFLRRLGIRPYLFHKLCILIRVAGETQDPLSTVCMKAWLNSERKRRGIPDVWTLKAGIKLNRKELDSLLMDLPIPDLEPAVHAINDGCPSPRGFSRTPSRQQTPEITKAPE